MTSLDIQLIPILDSNYVFVIIDPDAHIRSYCLFRTQPEMAFFRRCDFLVWAAEEYSKTHLKRAVSP